MNVTSSKTSQAGKINTSLIITIALFAIIAGGIAQQQLNKAAALPSMDSISMLPKTKTMADTEFVNHLNQTMRISDFKGKWSLMFFGFTHCPDVCPSTLQKLKQIKQTVSQHFDNSQQLIKGWGNYQVILMSVDPARDTPQQLANYVPYFDSSFIGLTGKPDNILQFAQQLGVPYQQEEADADGNYEVAHYAGIVVFNPQAQMVGLISAPHDIDQISEDLITLATHYASDHQQVMPLIDSQLKHTVMQNDATPQQMNLTNDGAITLTDAWIRPAPPNAPTRVVYGTLNNQLDQAIVIDGVSSPQFGMAMMHDTVIKNDVVKMVHNSKLTIPAGGSIIFKPQGKHIMLMQPKTALSLNDTATLHFLSQNRIVVNAQAIVKTLDE